MKFRSKLYLAGKTATGLKVPESVVTALGESRRPAVAVTINGYTYRSTISMRSGAFMLPVAAEVRAGAGIAAGETVEISIELDTAPREVEVPADFARAMKAAKVREVFDKLAYTHRKEHVRAIEEAKTAETRTRRIAKSVEMLKAGRK